MDNDTPIFEGGHSDLPSSWAEKLKVTIPGYRLLGEISRGGQAIVYRAEQETTGQIVAVKVLHNSVVDDAVSSERIRREVRALSVLVHPNIVKVFDRGTTLEGHEYLVMNYIAGQPLNVYLRESRYGDDVALGSLWPLRLFVKICDAVEAAHRIGIVHRDLSPSNILVDSNHEPHILDFGLARTAFDRFMQADNCDMGEDGFLGKIAYASPEQAEVRNGDIDSRTDVYSLGIILYGILSGGQFPYQVTGKGNEVVRNIIHSPPQPLRAKVNTSSDANKSPQPSSASGSAMVNAATQAIVFKALEKRPQQRYRTAGELGHAVATYLTNRPTTAEPSRPDSRIGNRSQIMRFTGFPERKALVGWARELRNIADARKNEIAVSAIETAIKQLEAEKVVITIMGKAKRGKSTLVNALLGRTDDIVAPIDKLPASSAISQFYWAESDQANITFRDGRKQSIGFPQICQYVTEEGNPENSKGVQLVEIGGQFAGLDRDLVLVDTPGAGSIHEHHDALLHGFLPRSDAVIFLVTARMPIDQDELNLLRSINAADISKVFFAINRIDEASSADLSDAVAHNQRLLAEAGICVKEIHHISAKRAFQGDFAGSGVPRIAAEIQGFLAANKAKVLEARFQSRVCQAIAPVAKALSVELAMTGRTAAEIEQQIRELQQKKVACDRDRTVSEREFVSGWRQAVDKFGGSLPGAKRDVLAKVSTRIEETSLTGVGKLARELPTLLVDTVEKRLVPEASRLEEALKTGCTRLRSDYPLLELGADSGGPMIRVRGGSIEATGALGGAAAAVAGIGIAGAGSAAAAGIAATNAAAVAAAAAAAAASVTSTTIPVATTASTLLAHFSLTSWLAPIFAGQATVVTTATAAAPVLTATPLWVAVAGPVGWTLAGIGAVAIPLAWRTSKMKHKDKLQAAAREEIEDVFGKLAKERVVELRSLGEHIIEDCRAGFERDVEEIERTLERARDQRPDEKSIAGMQTMASSLQRLMGEMESMSDAVSS